MRPRPFSRRELRPFRAAMLTGLSLLATLLTLGASPAGATDITVDTQVDSPSTSIAGDVDVKNGATLTIKSGGSISGSVHVESGTTVILSGGSIGAVENAGGTVSIFGCNLHLYPASSGNSILTGAFADGSPITIQTSGAIDLHGSAPVITVTGDNPLTWPCNTAFVDPGATASNCAGDVLVNSSSDVKVDTPGTYTVTYNCVDLGGMRASATRTVNVVATPPAFTNCPPTGTAAIATGTAGGIGAYVGFSPLTAASTCGGSPTVSYDHQPGSFFAPGTTAVTATAADADGGTTSCPFFVTVAYAWSGFLQPINTDGSSIFKLGSTVPVKFRLTGASASITNVVAKLYVAKMNKGIVGSDVEAVSTAAADTGNLFRYDPSGGQYIFNLSTKGLTTGTWQLSVDLGDGDTTRTVLISLK